MSTSGQFIITDEPFRSPLFTRANLSTNSGLIRLEPSLAAVSAERFKNSLWQNIGLKPGSAWKGKIFVTLRPALSPEDSPLIVALPYIRSKNYKLELPDVVSSRRYARALTATLLLEIASRETVSEKNIELPAWLADGLADRVIALEGNKIFLSTPERAGRAAIPETRLNKSESGLDPLFAARRILQQSTTLTFDELSWPKAVQVDGQDGGTYSASAQLFVHELLALKRGPEKLRIMLANLPQCMNWQTAFFTAFQEDFRNPLEVEKWWSLRVLSFAMRAPGPGWTPQVSRDRLGALLSVPVEIRESSNAMPIRAEFTLQDAIRNLPPGQQPAVFQMKVRDISLAGLRMAQPFSALAEGYRICLLEYLGEPVPKKPDAPGAKKNPEKPRRYATPADTLQKLDALDTERRVVETRMAQEAAPPPPPRST